jgi:Holliday junction resolvase RusA-like endonuclease
MNKISFTVFGEPKPQQRHRLFRRASFIQNYDPSKADKGDFLSVAMRHKPPIPFDTPLHVTTIFYFSRPKSHYRTGKFSGVLKDNAKLRTSRKDIDNLQKFVYDSLNKIFWKDDSIIASVTAMKIYSENPRTEITIKTLDENNQ